MENVKDRLYKTIILPVVLYGCETWSLTAREEHKLRVLENRVLRRIFGSFEMHEFLYLYFGAYCISGKFVVISCIPQIQQ
jgi:hypothetical protein